MEEYSWPGNTMHLENFCQKLLFSATSRNIQRGDCRRG
jgi:DNA-binding NtrC family response regulator